MGKDAFQGGPAGLRRSTLAVIEATADRREERAVTHIRAAMHRLIVLHDGSQRRAAAACRMNEGTFRNWLLQPPARREPRVLDLLALAAKVERWRLDGDEAPPSGDRDQQRAARVEQRRAEGWTDEEVARFCLDPAEEAGIAEQEERARRATWHCEGRAALLGFLEEFLARPADEITPEVFGEALDALPKWRRALVRACYAPDIGVLELVGGGDRKRGLDRLKAATKASEKGDLPPAPVFAGLSVGDVDEGGAVRTIWAEGRDIDPATAFAAMLRQTWYTLVALDRLAGRDADVG